MRGLQTKLVGGSILLAIVCVVLFVVSGTPFTTIAFEISKVLMSLIVAVIVTGLISSTLTRQAQRRNERLARLTALSTALQELKGAYEQMSVARTMLRADLSGRTFEQQLPAILSCRARLQRIERDRVIGNDELVRESGPISQMVTFTRGVRDVYVANYTRIIQNSLQNEGLRARMLNLGTPVEPIRLDLAMLADAKFLTELTAPKSKWHQSAFGKGYGSAKAMLERQILELRSEVG